MHSANKTRGIHGQRNQSANIGNTLPTFQLYREARVPHQTPCEAWPDFHLPVYRPATRRNRPRLGHPPALIMSQSPRFRVANRRQDRHRKGRPIGSGSGHESAAESAAKRTWDHGADRKSKGRLKGIGFTARIGGSFPPAIGNASAGLNGDVNPGEAPPSFPGRPPTAPSLTRT